MDTAVLANLIYLLLLTLASPLIVYRALRQGRYRRGWAAKLWGALPPAAVKPRAANTTRIWLHAVSVGEVNLLRGFVQRLRQRHPDVELLISSSTDTGYDLAIKHFGADHVVFAPLDFSWAARRALRRADVDLLILAELEIWPNWARIASRQNIPIAVINGRLSARSHRGYRRFRRLIAPTFRRLSLIACQDQDGRDRFIDLGVDPERIKVTGSLKYDDAPRSRDTVEIDECTHLVAAEPWHRIWLAGSTQPGEEAMALRIHAGLKDRFPELRLMLVPRHRERFEEVAELIRQHGLVCRRRSRVDAKDGERSWPNDTVFLVDSIGELKQWWGTAQIAFVGGSFGRRGGQNMLEPAGYGAAVAVGPSTHNFRDIVACLKAAEGIVEVNDEAELFTFVEMCLADPPRADALGRAARNAVAGHRGATERTLETLRPLLSARTDCTKHAA